MEWSKIIGILLENARNYFLTASIAFTIFYIFFKEKIELKKIQSKFPQSKDYRREIFYSIISIIIFSFPPVFILFNDGIRPYTLYYTDINQHSKLYFFSAFILMIFIHDAYFYWLHRLMHNKLLFKFVHLIHHKSTNPSPWAAYAFHPIEAILESGIFVLLLFIIPLQDWHLIVFFICSLIYNVYGHLGFELYPKGFSKNWFGKWINTSVNHNMHHQYFDGNYGLYFTFWDRIMGTIRPDYDEHYDKAKSK
ncbi:sterol desaturase family protein [Lacihabitans sp. CCS-44]|uniref:sterol desaturase family protein n=1 Tax=Lacihabitans sp. CCS-44 TaxID=2487331 RepID=UPI0020CEE11D|nr:sterol desaturase family protein [Lacihabitans sp. CCS-44]MCP9755967.1 sterol desaturase family protein [Lacihabitans sp. CCS-44]